MEHIDCSTNGAGTAEYFSSVQSLTHHPTISSSVIPFSYCFESPSIRVFSKELAFHIRWLKYQSFSFSISSSNDYSGLISFRIDWFDLLVAQGILKSLIHHHSLKALILQCSAFIVVQLSYPYMTTVCMYVCMTVSSHNFPAKKQMSLISLLQSPSTVILEPKEEEICHYFHLFPLYLP